MRIPALALLALAACPAAAGAAPAVGFTTPGEIVHFDTAAPGTITERHAITGLEPGDTVEGIDVRPVNGRVYLLGVIRGATDTLRLYTVDPGTGVAARVGSVNAATGVTPAEYGFDFNPASDRIRVVSRSEFNMRADPDTGVGQSPDTPLNPAGDVDAIAYSQNDPGAPVTTLFGYDSGVDRFVRIGGHNGEGSSPNNGVVTTFPGASGVSTTGVAGMDIAPGGAAFLAANTASGPGLYTAHLAAGTVTLIGSFPELVEDMSVLRPASFEFDGSAVVIPEDAGSVAVTVNRLGSTANTQTVAFATSDGSANGADYTPVATTLTFAPGEATKTVSVPITNDGADESGETVGLALSAPTGGATLGSPAQATLTILDDDGPPDTTKPALLVSAPTTRTRSQMNSGLKGRVAVSEGCKGTLRLLLGKSTLGSAALERPSATVRSFRVKLTSKGSKSLANRLKTRRSQKLSLTATCADAAGNSGTDRMSVTVRR